MHFLSVVKLISPGPTCSIWLGQLPEGQLVQDDTVEAGRFAGNGWGWSERPGSPSALVALLVHLIRSLQDSSIPVFYVRRQKSRWRVPPCVAQS